MNISFKTRGALRGFGTAVIVCAVLGALLRTLSLFFFYDSDIGYYSHGAPLPVIVNALIIVAFIGCALICFIPRISITPDTFGESRVVDILYLIPCLISAYAFVAQIYLVSQYSNIGLAIPKMQLLLVVLNAVAVIFFALSTCRTRVKPTLLIISGILTMLWLVLMLVSLYFDMYVQINSPNKTLMAFALVAAILFLSGELRLSIDDKKYGVRLFSSAIALIIIASSAVPSMIAEFGGAIGDTYSATLGDTVCLSLLFPVCARFIKLCFGKKQAA